MSLAVIGPLLFLGGAVAAMVWVVRDVQRRRPRDIVPWVWTRGTRVRLWLFLALVPLEAVLFRSGGIESPQNVVGVALVGWQWVLINRMFAEARNPS